jgi:PAS domain S-box-containing protein
MESPESSVSSSSAQYLLSAIIDSSDDAIWSETLDGTVTRWNQGAECIFGYTANEIIGKPSLALVPESRQAEEEALRERSRHGERIEHCETERLRKDGRRVPISLTISPIRSADGTMIGVSKLARDVTLQREAARTSALLSAIVESSDDAIISEDLTGIITSWNNAAQRMFGYIGAEIVGQTALKLIPPELRTEEPAILDRLRAGERIDHYETVRLRKDGRRIDVALTISPIKGTSGNIFGVSKVVRDITSDRKADHALRLLAAIVDSTDDAIVSKDLNGIVTSWNAGAERIFGYKAEEMIGRPVEVLFPRDRLDEEPKILDRLKRGDRVDHYQTVRVRKSGEAIHVSLTISPIKDASGRVVGASKIARDITKEKQWVAQLAAMNEDLKRVDRMKSEFLAIMSHELRTPLNSILGFASVLRQGRSGPVTDNQIKQLNLIHASGKHLLNLINDVLDLSRIEAGRLELDCEDFQPGEVIEEAIRTLALQTAQKKLTVHSRVDFAGIIYSDRKRFFQIVLNLLNNAVKFTQHGTIDIAVAAQGDQLVVRVTDTGIGIPEDKLSTLFQAFSQVEGSSRRRHEGTGLGLYLCKKIITVLQGEITVDSEPNRGSVFTFRIPLRHVEAAHLQSVAEPATA